MATFRGLDGSVTFGGNAVGEVIAWTLNTQLDTLDASVMGAAWKANTGGMGQWTATVTCRLDGGDTGQADMIDDVVTATPTGSSAACIFTVSSSGPKQYTGNGIVTAVGKAAAIGNIVELSVTILGDGALAVAWS